MTSDERRVTNRGAADKPAQGGAREGLAPAGNPRRRAAPLSHRSTLDFQRIDGTNVDALAEGLSALHEAVRGERRDPRYWRWCYVDNPLGRSGAVAALEGGRVVGRLGQVPVRLVSGGRPVVAGLYEGLHVLPEARSWRCYSGLVGTGYLNALADGLPFTYAFVTRRGRALASRVGGLRLGRVPFAVGFLNVARALSDRSVPRALAAGGALLQPWLGLRRRGGSARGVEVRPVAEFGPDFDDLWQALAARRGVAAVRDAAYLNWRYARCPGRHYACLAAYSGRRLDGLAVVLARTGSAGFTPRRIPRGGPRRGTERRDGFILELLARDDDRVALETLLLRALDVLEAAGAGAVAASFPARSAEAALLGRFGFRPWPGWRLGMELVLSPTESHISDSAGEVPPLGPRGRASSALHPEHCLSNWYFSLGDWLAY